MGKNKIDAEKAGVFIGLCIRLAVKTTIVVLVIIALVKLINAL